jgi:hypothetical protein
MTTTRRGFFKVLGALTLSADPYEERGNGTATVELLVGVNRNLVTIVGDPLAGYSKLQDLLDQPKMMDVESPIYALDRWTFRVAETNPPTIVWWNNKRYESGDIFGWKVKPCGVIDPPITKELQ